MKVARVEFYDQSCIVPCLYFLHKHGHAALKIGGSWAILVGGVKDEDISNKDSSFWLSLKNGTDNLKEIYNIQYVEDKA